jgi:hypothetical protein
MTLAPGTRLGSYEILAPLGAGGMGEVYSARDARLGREVAIKVLPAEVAGDAERLARFEREAKAVSALNHPHIVTLYELGASERGPFLVLEKIDGRSLRELLRAGALPVKRVLTLGAQIAEGLAKAHSVGIVHRDLKPDNVMVSEDGFAKILDFGLAKLVWPELEGGAAEQATTLAGPTASGIVLGTPGYLSPEQAVGRAADFRADQFALGALLYEMATGERPFRGETTGESLAAVLRDEPAPLRAKNPALPAPLGWLVERCLAKDPNDRYGSTRDLARDLADLRDHLSEISRGGEAAAQAGTGRVAWHRRTGWRLAGVGAAAAVAIAAAGIALSLAGRRTDGEPPSYRLLNPRRGIVTGARFSPDGATVYYSAAFGAEPSRVYVMRLEGSESRPLDLPPAILLSVSRKGELLVLLTEERNQGNSVGTLARVSALGGAPRPLIDDALDGEWMPDGESFAVVRGRTELRFELPPGEERFRGIRHARLSPDGSRLAFFDLLSQPTAIEIHELGGGRLLHHEIPFVWGLAWHPDGREIWFTGTESQSGTDRALYALSLSGERRLRARTAGPINLFDVAPDGASALVATGSSWIGIAAIRAGEPGERTLDLFGRTVLAGISADGHRVLADEQREMGRGAYLLVDGGEQSVRLGDQRPLALSPDGAWALVSDREEPAKMTLLPTGAGIPEELAGDATGRPPALIPGVAHWSANGAHLFALLAPLAAGDEKARVHRLAADRSWRPVSPEGVESFVVSPDGRELVTRRPSGELSIVPVDGGAPRPLQRVQGFPVGWSPDGGGILVRAPGSIPAHLQRVDLASGRVEPWRTISPVDPGGAYSIGRVIVAPDGRSVAYNVFRVSNELFLVEGLRRAP